jgi:carbamoyl-phosphate synthase large subunit
LVLNEIIAQEKIDFVHAQNDVEVTFLSEKRDRIAAKVLLPAKSTVRVCQDKFRSFQKWEAAGIKVPRTILIRTRDDLEQAFAQLGGKVWLRAISGAGGRGALPANDIQTAVSWLDFQKGWNGTFTAAELLEKDSITWMSLWHDGQLVVAQGRRRLYWELGRISPSGVTGATGAGETVSDPVLDGIAQAAILAIDEKPEGLFGVDLTYDRNSVPNPTEINVGRLFTTHQFFTELGVNMPYLFVKIAFGEKLPRITKKLNPAPNNMIWIRGIDFVPVLTSMAEIKKNVANLESLRHRLG